MTGYERIKLTLEHKEADRIPLVLAWPWPETVERWKAEGMPEDADMNENPYESQLAKAFPHKIYEETDDYVIDRNTYGVKLKWWKHRYTTHTELDWGVKNYEDWKKVKWALDVSDERLIDDFPEKIKEARGKGYFVCLSPEDHFWFSFKMLGMQNLCVQMALDPDFIHDLYDTFTNFSLEMLDKVMARGIDVDAIWFFSDMAFKNAPMFSPEFFKEFLEPYYKKFRKFCDSHGLYMFLHSDGDMTKLMPGLIRCGFDFLHPLEAKAGMDVRALKPIYGKDITFFGNISAVVISEGTDEEIEEEVRSKIEAAKAGGGYIFSIDHSTPPGVSLRNNKFMFECARKYADY